jgi:hypothetical protein
MYRVHSRHEHSAKRGVSHSHVFADPAIKLKHLCKWHVGTFSIQVKEKSELVLPRLVCTSSTSDLAQEETVHIELMELSPHLDVDARLGRKYVGSSHGSQYFIGMLLAQVLQILDLGVMRLLLPATPIVLRRMYLQLDLQPIDFWLPTYPALALV